MSTNKKIASALISVYNKDGLEEMLSLLDSNGVKFISTGGTRHFIESLGYECAAVEDITAYPSIFGGRVKTLHPKIFGGILNRRDNATDRQEVFSYRIEPIDLVVVDLYPFEDTLASGASHADIIEKIDIGGISLIRAAAKNYKDVVIVPSKAQYATLCNILKEQGAETTEEQRLSLARDAFAVSSRYDAAIFNYFDSTVSENPTALRLAVDGEMHLRYGENPHQKGCFFGHFDEMFDKLHGKEISYNNLLDIDAATALIHEFKDSDPTVAILKHNNPCGLAVRPTLAEAWEKALAGDPVSAFGGIIVANRPVDAATAELMGKIFFEVVIAPAYEPAALEILEQKKNRIILVQKKDNDAARSVRTLLNGALVQDKDSRRETPADLTVVTEIAPDAAQVDDMLFANILVKHSKSNAIVLAKDNMLLSSGIGQTSRVDALKQAIAKAGELGHDLHGAVLASDAFFPFDDCVRIAAAAGITSVIQPGGSIRDNDSVVAANELHLAMVTTGIRHFHH